MRRPFLTACLVGSLCFFSSAQPGLCGEDAILVAKGIQRIQARAFEDAAEVLSQALAMNPNDPEANYYMGYACLRLGRYGEAETFLLASLEKDPMSSETYFELGILASYLGECEKAKANFVRFEDLSPDDTRLQAAEDYVRGCEGGEGKEGVFRLQVTVGGQYDTNVILEPSNPQAPADKKGDFRGLLFLSGGATPLKSDRVNLHLDYDFYQSAHTERNGFNLTYNRVTPWVEVFLSDAVQASAGYVFEHSILKWDGYGMAHQGRTSVRVEEGERLFSEGTYTYTNMTYRDTDLFPSNDDRSGYRNTVECRQRLEFGGSGHVDLYGSGDFERAKQDFWSFNGFRFGAASGMRVLPSLHVGLDAGYVERRYRSDDPFENRRRRDRAFEGNIMLTYLISDRVGITLSNNTTVNDSTIRRYKYQRNVTGIFVTVGIL